MDQVAHSILFDVSNRGVKTSLSLEIFPGQQDSKQTKSQTKYQRRNDLTESIGGLDLSYLQERGLRAFQLHHCQSSGVLAH